MSPEKEQAETESLTTTVSATATTAVIGAALLLKLNRAGNLLLRLGRDLPRELLGSFRAAFYNLTSFLLSLRC